MMKRTLAIIAAIIIIAAAGTAIFELPPQEKTAAATPTAASPSAGWTKSAYFDERTATGLGTYLTDATGRTLYVFTKDRTDATSCTGSCATVWLPYGPSLSGSGLFNMPMLPAEAGIMKRPDGTAQFTWNDKPLYYYAKDTAMGDTLGEGVQNAWYVAKP